MAGYDCRWNRAYLSAKILIAVAMSLYQDVLLRSQMDKK
jgi:hypothetical protein